MSMSSEGIMRDERERARVERAQGDPQVVDEEHVTSADDLAGLAPTLADRIDEVPPR